MHVNLRMVTVAMALGCWSPEVRGQLTQDQRLRIEAAIADRATVSPRQPRRVLIWNTPFLEDSPHRGFSIPQGEYAWVTLGRKTGAFEPVVSNDVAVFLPEHLQTFDAVVLNNSSGDWIRPTERDLPKFAALELDQDAIEKRLRQSLLDWVADGGGVVGVHHAIGGNVHWPEFRELIGAGYWGHPWNEEVGVRLAEPDHPLLRAFGGRDFRIAEEIFQFREPYSRKTLRVLLALDIRHTNMTRPWIYREDDDFALAWIQRRARGRVFYAAFGHRTEHWWDPMILRFYLDGIQYACGDLVVEDAPSAFAGVEEGFERLFNGRDLQGWRGNPQVWSVEGGVITGRTTGERRIAENDFLIWTGGEVRDFELRLRYRLLQGNSGVYFRAMERTSVRSESLVGIQADLSADHQWTGTLYEYTRRGFIARRGERTVMENGGVMKVVGQVGDPQALLAHVKDGWNDYTISARGGHLVLKINGVVMCEAEDNDPWRLRSGLLALQVHQGEPMTVQFKDIRIRHD